MRTTLVCVLSALALAASAEPAHDLEGDVPAADGLSGREIFDRVLAHRVRAFYLEAELENGNGKGDSRRMRFVMLWQDLRAEGSDALSKTRIELEWPFFLRFGGILIERSLGRPAQQWAYFPEFRWTRRVSLRGQSLHGSCFSFDDIVPREAEDFLYRRLADGVYEGEPVYRVELTPRPHAPAEHSRILVSVDRARDVVVRSRYWNAAGEETKELRIPSASLEERDGSWFPMRLEMRDRTSGCFSTIRVTHFTANPELGPRAFDLGRLEAH
jgi:hypothetical protein